eukprot:scaffold231629_cov33-Prasinocladus_malaysianus.AAC.1
MAIIYIVMITEMGISNTSHRSAARSGNHNYPQQVGDKASSHVETECFCFRKSTFCFGKSLLHRQPCSQTANLPSGRGLIDYIILWIS